MSLASGFNPATPKKHFLLFPKIKLWLLRVKSTFVFFCETFHIGQIMKQAATLFILFLSTLHLVNAQNDSLTAPKFSSTLWGNIFTAFYYSPGQKVAPDKGFEFSTGLLGYKAQWGDKATATLIYDVFKTTDHIQVYDTSGNSMPVSYFRGSDYTAFLKMAQIDYRLNPRLQFSVGQLLNQQYLTYQDRFWGFRYISTTFQELYRFGAPADFGARVTYLPHPTLAVSVGVVNGNGPFRQQSDDGEMQYFTNIEWTPAEGFIVKVFADRMPVADLPARNVLSLFTGYRTDAWRLGFEYNYVENDRNDDALDFSGVSTYGAVMIAEGWHFLARHDYISKSAAFENEHYIITGLEYEPYKGFFTSVNYRFLTRDNVSWIYASFGARF